MVQHREPTNGKGPCHKHNNDEPAKMDIDIYAENLADA